MTIYENKKIYRITSSYRIWMIAPIVAWFFLLSIPFLLKMKISGSFTDFLFVFIPITLFGFILVTDAITEKIVVSPSGIELHTLLSSRSVNWEDAFLVETGAFGFIWVVFTLPSNTSRQTIFSLRRFNPYVKVPISFFVEDYHASDLIKDIETFAPSINISAAIKDKKSLKPHQKGSSLGLFILIFFVISILISSFAEDLALYIEDNMVKGAGFILIMGSMGLLGSIIGGGLSLLEYNGVLKKSGNEADVEHYALSFYWSPLVGTGLAMVLGGLIFSVLSFLHYRAMDTNVIIFNLLAFFVGFRASNICRWFFQWRQIY